MTGDEEPIEPIKPDEREWPWCSWCGRRAVPGLECDKRRCPWARVDGRIIDLSVGSG